MKFLANSRALLIALWLGSAVFFSFAVAPSVFSILASREMAGSVVNRTLSIVNFSGIVIGVVLLLSSLIFSKNIGWIKLAFERVLSLILTVACGVGQFVIAARLHNIREQVGRPMEELPVDDPFRIAFNDLHGHSITVLSIGMISAIIIFFLLAQRGNKTENR